MIQEHEVNISSFLANRREELRKKYGLSPGYKDSRAGFFNPLALKELIAIGDSSDDLLDVIEKFFDPQDVTKIYREILFRDPSNINILIKFSRHLHKF